MKRAGPLMALTALVTLTAGGEGCATFDTTRSTPVRGSLGREMYTLVCDRVGAQALREDVTGGSYHAVCHADAGGAFADAVDRARLPPLDPGARDIRGEVVPLEQQRANREHRVARIEAVARRRDDLIAAFDEAFTGEEVATRDLGNPDPRKSCESPASKPTQAALETEVAGMLGRLTDLYNDDTIPFVTRSLAHVMDDTRASPDAQAALARFDARRGYRPTDIAMGAIRPALSYPRFTELANALVRVLATGDNLKSPGAAHAGLVHLMAALHEELRTAKEEPKVALLVTKPDTADATLERLSRPRGNLEMTRAILLREDPRFSIGEPRWLVARDPRGFARVALDESGTIPSPFVDRVGQNGKPDGLADVDDLGRFVTLGNTPAPQPFVDFYGEPAKTQRDASGRALRSGRPAFEYIDVRSTFLAALSRDLVAMLDPNVKSEHETVMDLLSGFVVAAGQRDDEPTTRRAYEGGVSLSYRAYRTDTSPVLDLVHALGQVLAQPTTEDTLALVQRLAQDKPHVLARLVGMGLEIKAIADKHDEAKIPESSALWDDVLDVATQIAQRPALVEDVIRAFGDDATPGLPRSAVPYLTMRDHLSYDRDNLNGPPLNRTTTKVEPPKTPVDRQAPDTAWNRSVFQRFLQALHDVNGMSVCTKEGAVAHVVWNGLPLDFPSLPAQAACVVLGAPAPKNPSPRCGLIRFENIGRDIVDAAAGSVKLDIRDECLRRLIASPLTGIVGGADAFLEDVSGIKGLTTRPTIPGIDRLIFFDLPHDGLGGDGGNLKTRNFLRDLYNPPETLVCPASPFTDTDGKVLNLRSCSRFADSLRGRDEDALFPIETLGFIDAAKPLAQAFQKNDAHLLFIDLFDALHRHWGSKAQTKDECDPAASKQDARWCSQDGAVTYEPLIAEALGSDLFPALHDAVRELEAIRIPHCDARDPQTFACTKVTPRDGVKVLAEAIKTLLDPRVNKGLAYRDGRSTVIRNDGTNAPQVTPIYLLIDALKGFDARFAQHADALPGDDRIFAWRRARSHLVDRLFTVSGKGKDARFANRAVEGVLPVVVSALRAQLAAHCPDPARGCEWGRSELTKKTTDVVAGPTFAGMMETLDAVRADVPARTELERLLVHLLDASATSSAKDDPSGATLGALTDLLQVFEDDTNMTALLRAAHRAAAPEIVEDEKVTSRGFVLAVVEVIARVLAEAHTEDGTRVCADEIDPSRTLAIVLRRMVTPSKDGRPPPIEVLIDVVADVNRSDPAQTTKLEPGDYGNIAREVSEFCTHPSRGLEQVYEVIKQATKDL